MTSKVTVNWDALKAIPPAIVIVAGGYAFYLVDWSFARGHITDYALQCSAYGAGGSCAGTYKRGPVTVYIVNTDQQYVISQTDGCRRKD
jgi:hypothetical protein